MQRFPLLARLRRFIPEPGLTLVDTSQQTTRLRIARPYPIVITLMLIVMAIVFPSRVWTVLLAGMITVLLGSFMWAWRTGRGARIERSLLHTWVQVGDLLEEAITLANDSRIPIIAAEVEDLSDIPGYAQSAVRAAGAYAATTWRQNGTSRRRGLYHLGPTRIRLTDPLGIFTVTSEHPEKREILVFPPVLQNINTGLMSGGGQGTVTMRQRSLQETAAVGSVRGYHPGDPVRRIHWPLSARYQHLVVKEFDREMGGDVWLALDLDANAQIGHDEDSTLEDVIVWGASYAWHLVRAGKRVGLFTYGPRRVMLPPQGGTGQLWNILRSLAPINANERIPLPVLLQEVTPYVARGDALVVITPSTQPGWPEHLAKPALNSLSRVVVLIEAALPMPEGSTLSEQITSEIQNQAIRLAAIRALLNDLNVPVIVASQNVRREAVPAVRGSGNWDFVTTAAGRVVVRTRPARAHA
jgi:uncharacterized protein (DUF58 family)